MGGGGVKVIKSRAVDSNSFFADSDPGLQKCVVPFKLSEGFAVIDPLSEPTIGCLFPF